MKDHRTEPRWPAFLRGVISCNRKLWSADCIVKNKTPNGAKLQVRDLTLVPDHFDLSIPQHNAEYRVRLKWRRNGEIGVAIEETCEAETSLVEQDQRRRIRRLERETRSLRSMVSFSD
jgi:hypothetical protein